MKFKKNKDRGTVDIKGMPIDMFECIQQATFDLANGDCILRYDTQMYSKWARPTKETRGTLKMFNSSIPLDLQPFFTDWMDRFESVCKPKFKKREVL